MGKRTSSAGIVLYKGSSVLLVMHTELAKLPTGSYGFPAGHVEDDEEPIDCAIRELEEEAGLKTSREHLRKLPSVENTLQMKNGTKDFVFHPFLCIKYTGELKASDKTIPEFVELDLLDDLLLVSDNVKDIARQWYLMSDK